jgi:hypothetical protein
MTAGKMPTQAREPRYNQTTDMWEVDICDGDSKDDPVIVTEQFHYKFAAARFVKSYNSQVIMTMVNAES